MRFYVGTDAPNHLQYLERAFLSVNRIKNRKSMFTANEWIMDSGAFTQISTHGDFQMTTEDYARHINRFQECGSLLAVVSQDWMCEPFVLKTTGLTVREHQERTIDRYLRLQSISEVYVMPVIQGYAISEYLAHIRMYGGALATYAWVGVGSVCKRNANVGEIEDILSAIKHARPDLRLHGFGLKTTALKSGTVVELLESADSMAWCYAARKQGRNPHCWREAKSFGERINTLLIEAPNKPKQTSFMLCT